MDHKKKKHMDELMHGLEATEENIYILNWAKITFIEEALRKFIPEAREKCGWALSTPEEKGAWLALETQLPPSRTLKILNTLAAKSVTIGDYIYGCPEGKAIPPQLQDPTQLKVRGDQLN